MMTLDLQYLNEFWFQLKVPARNVYPPPDCQNIPFLQQKNEKKKMLSGNLHQRSQILCTVSPCYNESIFRNPPSPRRT